MNSSVNANPNLDLADHMHMYIDENDNGSNPLDFMSVDSEYYDADNIIPQHINIKSYQYKVLHLNIQGLHSKFDNFKILLSQLNDQDVKLDFILLCETFLNDNNADLYNIPGYFFIYKNRKKLSKGGVAMYISNTINFKVRNDVGIFEEGEFESIFIETLGNKSSAIIGEIYRMPNTNAQRSLEMYESILNKLGNTYSTVIIGTDQNFDLLKIDTDKTTSALLDICLSSNMIPTITKPTRVTHSSATLIDNIYIKHVTSDIHSGIIYVNLSDHFPVFCFFGSQIVIKPTKPLIFKYRPMTDIVLGLITNTLDDTNWDNLLNADTIQAYENFTSKLNDIVHRHAPEKTVTIQPNFIIREKWMTKGLMKSSRNLNKLYRKCSKKPQTHQSYIHYKTYRNCYNKLKLAAKTIYYSVI
jgi:hypothetical protein